MDLSTHGAREERAGGEGCPSHQHPVCPLIQRTAEAWVSGRFSAAGAQRAPAAPPGRQTRGHTGVWATEPGVGWPVPFPKRAPASPPPGGALRGRGSSSAEARSATPAPGAPRPVLRPGALLFPLLPRNPLICRAALPRVPPPLHRDFVHLWCWLWRPLAALNAHRCVCVCRGGGRGCFPRNPHRRLPGANTCEPPKAKLTGPQNELARTSEPRLSAPVPGDPVRFPARGQCGGLHLREPCGSGMTPCEVSSLVTTRGS